MMSKAVNIQALMVYLIISKESLEKIMETFANT